MYMYSSMALFWDGTTTPLPPCNKKVMIIISIRDGNTIIIMLISQLWRLWLISVFNFLGFFFRGSSINCGEEQCATVLFKKPQCGFLCRQAYSWCTVLCRYVVSHIQDALVFKVKLCDWKYKLTPAGIILCSSRKYPLLPMEGIFWDPLPLWKFQLSPISFSFVLLQPPPPVNSNPFCGGSWIFSGTARQLEDDSERFGWDIVGCC